MRFPFSRSSFLMLGAAIAVLFYGCGERYAGSEVTNPPQKVTGYVRAVNGAAAPGAVVVAYPSDYDPVLDAGTLRDYRDTTDSAGHYALDKLDSSETYNIWAVGAALQGRDLVREIKPDTGGAPAAPDAKLNPPGALSIFIHDSLPKGKAYVYLAGTPLSQGLQSLGTEPGYVLLDSVASGLIPKLYHKVNGAGGARTLLAENILVRPGDTVPIGPYAPWKGSKRIFLNTTAAGADVAGSVGAIPLIIRLDASNFDFSQAKDDGSDIRFAAKNGTALPYEIETWDKAAKKAAIWVRALSVKGGDAGQCLRIYWGNPSATSESDGRAVFDTSFHYSGVWHLNALGTGTPPELQDASAAGNTAYAGDYPTGLALTETPLGLGMHQNGLISALSTKNAIDDPTTFTISIWFRTVTDSGGLLIGFNRWQPNADTTQERDRQIWMDDSGMVHYGVATPTSNPAVVDRHILSGPVPLNDGKWHFAVGMVSLAGTVFYIDGKKVGLDASVTTAQPYTGYWRMGFTAKIQDWTYLFPGKYFKGDLDEGRVAGKVFPDDWVKLSYQNQAADGHLIRFDPD